MSEPAKSQIEASVGRGPDGGAKAAAEVFPAASVILLRDADRGLEVLMLRRTSKASFAADAWVFPGGRIDPEDGLDPLSMEAARRGAARETVEEAGIVVDPASLVPYSQWCPPPESPKRFLTWFFVAAAPQGDVTVDGGEITEHEWVLPSEAIAGRDEGRLGLLPPTWVTLQDLARRGSVEEVLNAARDSTPPYFETHIAFLDREDDSGKQDVVALWEGDAGYDTRDASTPGARNRLRMNEGAWFYEHS